MNPNLQASQDFCRRVARREAGNFYGSFLLLPPDRRRAMCALYAFLRRTDDLADSSEQTDRKVEALARWRVDLASALRGNLPTEDWAGWPALVDAVDRFAIDPADLVAVVDGVEVDLHPRTFRTWEDLASYCDLVATAVGRSCLHVWGFQSGGGRAERLAQACGRALQLTNIIRDVGEDARAGRIYLPEDERERFGVEPSSLVGPGTVPEVRALLQFQADRAERLFREADPLLALVDPVGRPALRAITGVYHALLREIVRRDFTVLAGRVRVPTWRKLGILVGSLWGWRTITPADGPPHQPARPVPESSRCV